MRTFVVIVLIIASQHTFESNGLTYEKLFYGLKQ